jgi:hypothetical protein
MSTALTQPTGAQIVGNLPTVAGAMPTIGTLTAATIDATVAANPLTNPVRRAYLSIKSVVSDWAALSDERYPFAYRALLAACMYELEAVDRANRMPIPNADGGGLEYMAYQAKMQYFAEQVGLELRQIGILSSEYYTFTIGTAERIGGANELNLIENYQYGTHC